MYMLLDITSSSIRASLRGRTIYYAKNDVQEPQMEFKKGREFTEWVIRPDWKDEIRKTFFKRGQMM